MPRICEVGGEPGIFLPLFGEAEANWPDWLQAVLYLLGLLWLFMAVAIIADVFMGAIEKITSKKKRKYVESLGREVTVKVWNDTVANLTLMALGSSAPEILLNVKEVFETKFTIGALGAMTIVGSAAFNLLIIIAVCVSSIPAGETRVIKELGVYSVTATFSVFAYLWLLFIVVAPPTPDSVSVYEGVLTFCFFPILVFIAYLVDIGKLPGTKKPTREDAVRPELSQEDLVELEHKVREKYSRDLTAHQVAALIEFEITEGPPFSRAFHRVNATRALFRGKTVMGDSGYHQGRKLSAIAAKGGDTQLKGVKVDGAILSFEAAEYIVLESQGTVTIQVNRTGDMNSTVKVTYKTRDGSAQSGSDYDRTEGEFEFNPGESKKQFDIGIHNSEGHEETEEFYVELTLVHEGGGQAARLGDFKSARVRIIDENHPGKLAFDDDQMHIRRPVDEKTFHINVRRKRGHDGEVSCEYRTEDDSAIAGADYEAAEGRLTFGPRQTNATFPLKLLKKHDSDKSEAFRVVLKDPSHTVMFDETMDGGKESAILTVFLDPLGKASPGAVQDLLNLNRDQLNLGHANWKNQFTSALLCNGDEEGEKEATMSDWAIHFIALPWKVMFAMVPPVDFAGGWVCFFVALAAIGLVTILIGDLASMLGCALHISEFATAITFVALGTSLPDTFASRSAAVQDSTADASIGNVTGSNSVNVFLGLGLPWMIGAIYWYLQDVKPGHEWYRMYPDLVSEYPSGAFVVRKEGLGLSVGVFSGCSVVCIATLAIRRKCIGAELGGPVKSKYVTSAFFVLLWVVYIVISILNAPEDS